MKHYQIVIKGMLTNKIDVIETISLHDYKETLKELKKCSFINLITTNIY